MAIETGIWIPEPASGWLASSVLRWSAEPYARHLARRGYPLTTIRTYLGGVAHFGHWLTVSGFGTAAIDQALVRRFVDVHVPACRCARRCRRGRGELNAALSHLIEVLRIDGLIAPELCWGSSALSAEIERFDRYLLDVCGLASTTRHTRRRHVHRFLDLRFKDGPVRISDITPVDVHDFVRRIGAAWSPGSVGALGNSLRSYFRFKALEGADTSRLALAIPKVAHWSLAALPKVLPAGDVERLLAAFDDSDAVGRRDYAMARCIADLGLRAAETARLRLEDLDWGEGAIRIHGKGRRVDRLPLLASTGRALSAYLRQGRPQTSSRFVFVRHRAPFDAPVLASTVRGAIRRAADRCGLADRVTGTHVLRHTVAGRMVERGTKLKDIADVLRHRCLDSTAIYAKVDMAALASVAMPWPEFAS